MKVAWTFKSMVQTLNVIETIGPSLLSRMQEVHDANRKTDLRNR
jgi:hypothetical protein